MSIIENPFLNNKTTLFHLEETSGDVVELNQQNVAKYYQYIYIVVKRNNSPINPEFYNWQLSQDVLNDYFDQWIYGSGSPVFYGQYYSDGNNIYIKVNESTTSTATPLLFTVIVPVT